MSVASFVYSIRILVLAGSLNDKEKKRSFLLLLFLMQVTAPNLTAIGDYFGFDEKGRL